jgi:glycine/D-amino acid oxidase-like deaminating enzyme
MARIVVAGAGATGASIAYNLALLGADDVVLADPRGIAGGSTSRAMGGIRQQFSTAAEVRLAQASIRFFAELGAPLFWQVGYLFVATTESGLAALEERRALQESLGVPVERVDPREVPGLFADDVLGAVTCREDGVADPPAVGEGVPPPPPQLGVQVQEGVDAVELGGDVLVIACGPWSREVAGRAGVELPIRPLCRQLVDTEPVGGLPESLPMVIEAETGFHFRRVPSGGLRLAMGEEVSRWGFETEVDERLVEDWLGRLTRRYPPAAGIGVDRAWAGLYDMTPDAHPILGWVADGVYAACGFSGHGFMQSPAVGRAAAEELLHGEAELELSPFRLDRFAGDEVFPETLVL